MSDEASTNKPVMCNRCGRPNIEDELKVPEAVMQEYLRCVLGGRLYSRTITILDTIDVTLEVLPADTELELEKLLRHSTSSDLNATDVRLLLSLKSITRRDSDTGELVTLYEKSVADRKDLLKDPNKGIQELAAKLDSTMLGVVRRAGVTFMLACAAILEQMVGSDFYEGVGLF